MDGLSSSSFWCSGGKGWGGGGASRLYAFCLLFCLCFSAAVVAPAALSGEPPHPTARSPPVYDSTPRPGVLDSSLYHPGDEHCLLTAIHTATNDILTSNPRAAAKLLRLFFHDCMTTGGGCDASILSPREINDEVNEALIAMVPIIDTIRDKAGRQCGVLPTLADTIAEASASAISFSGLGSVPSFRLGRRDLAPALAGNDPATLPNENQPIDDILSLLTGFGLTMREVTVWSIGGHSIGVADCDHFSSRLNNVSSFPGCLRPADPTLDPQLACKLAEVCSGGEGSADFDPRTPFLLDTSYFQLLLRNEGLIKSDQAFTRHPRTSGFIQEYAFSSDRFKFDFVRVFVKVSLININGPRTAPPAKYYYP